MSLPVDGHGMGGDAALDLYYTDPRPKLSTRDVDDVENATDVVATLLLTGSGLLESQRPEPVWLDNAAALARAWVWTAVGMINVGLQLNTVDALATLRGYAYGHNTTVDNIARSLTERELPVAALND